MEIEQSFTVPYPRGVVWNCFRDAPGIVACLPGASLTAPPDEGRLKLAMTVKLGPIVASFAGDGEMKLDDTAWRGSVVGGGVDRKSASRVKGEASFSLDDPTPGETRVDVKVDYAIAGSLAQFSRGGIVKELATRMTEAFAANLKDRLDLAASEAAVTTTAPVAEPELATVSAPGLVTTPATPVPPVVQATDIAPTQTANPVAKPPANAPLNLGSMFWKILWSRVRGLIGRGGA
ncbi:SRPBCC domain-containing protein [Paraburkholderia sp. RL18-103-BIB-C]|jgi:carbon monoxide dehydrogenase subunit G|uniref:SRPBCC family protein n=1 Tax=unclassified Paraburkholderia TaxID=2615204 RepID=UPI0038B9C043